MIKYRISIYYQTELMKKVTEGVRQLILDWKRGNKRLVGCQVYEFYTEGPLPAETIEKIKALKEDWMEEIVVEEVR